jgi:hypothetical protein
MSTIILLLDIPLPLSIPETLAKFPFAILSIAPTPPRRIFIPPHPVAISLPLEIPETIPLAVAVAIPLVVAVAIPLAVAVAIPLVVAVAIAVAVALATGTWNR